VLIRGQQCPSFETGQKITSSSGTGTVPIWSPTYALGRKRVGKKGMLAKLTNYPRSSGNGHVIHVIGKYFDDEKKK
jgi:hypothetical protein